MAAALVNSLLVVQSASVMCLLFCGKALTEFNTDSYGNILWDEVPAKTTEQEYSTEGRRTIGWDGFCRISFSGSSTCFFTVLIAISKAIKCNKCFVRHAAKGRWF